METEHTLEGRDTYYWYERSKSTEVAEVCAWLVEEADSAKELAHVACLVCGAGLGEQFGPTLETKVTERLQALYAGQRRDQALAEARWLGAALATLGARARLER